MILVRMQCSLNEDHQHLITARKVMDITTRLPGCSGQAADAAVRDSLLNCTVFGHVCWTCFQSCTAKEHVSDHLHALHYHRILTRGSGARVGRGGASLCFAVIEWFKCRLLVKGSQGGEETPATAVGGDQQQRSMGRFSRLLGRPKCFSGREDEWHDWSLKFGAMVATLSDHASVWMSGALQHTTEITLDQPDEASARIFARQMCVPFSLICVRDERWQSFEERLITTAWKRGDYCMNGIS